MGIGRVLVSNQHGTSDARLSGQRTSFDTAPAEGAFADLGGVE